MTNELPFYASGKIIDWKRVCVNSDTTDADMRAAADYLGEGSGCPVRHELILRRGAETMLARYREVNMWYWNIIEMVRSVNPKLAAAFEQPTPRSGSEPIGKHEADSVPAGLKNSMVGLGHPLGYAIPRAVIELLQPFTPDSPQEQEALLFVQDAVLECAHENGRMMDFTLQLLDRLVYYVHSRYLEKKVSTRILYHTLSKGKMEEDNCFGLYHSILKTIGRHAPTPYLASAYNALSRDDRKKAGIVDPADIPVYVRTYTQDHRSRMVLVIRNHKDPAKFQIERRMEVIEPVVQGEDVHYKHVRWLKHLIPTLYSDRIEAVRTASEIR